MRIGVISDTHGRLDPRVVEMFAGVDHILHAGDIGGEEILDGLRKIAPLTAVAGNIDGFRCGQAGEETIVELGGMRFYLVHVLDRPSRPRPEVEASLGRLRPDVVIFGHSHLPHNERVESRWYFNPASAGPRRFDLPRSVGLFEKNHDQWSAVHIALDDRSVAALRKTMNQLSRPH
jgi:uncharacterized protein